MERESTSRHHGFCSVALAGLAFAANAGAECSRETLQELADTYVAAQTGGNAALVPLASGAYYGENDKAVDVARACWPRP